MRRWISSGVRREERCEGGRGRVKCRVEPMGRGRVKVLGRERKVWVEGGGGGLGETLCIGGSESLGGF